MLLILRRDGTSLETITVAPGWRMPPDTVWVELVNPARDEELAVEGAMGIELPTREEMAEIEVSSRLYQEHDATFMIATLLCGAEAAEPILGPVTFVLAGERLITIRYVQPRVFSAFAAQALRQPELKKSGVDMFLGLLEAIVDRTADHLERTAAEVDQTGQDIFRQAQGASFKPILNRLARSQSVNGKGRESLVSLSRVISFAMLAGQISENREARDQLRSLQRDVQSLTEHASYVSSNLNFLLDAALGFINIEQNEITKIFSIAAVVFLPPTVIAGWYGMNFHHMPELDWPWAYPATLLAMLLSAVAPLWWVKRKGWL
jgi:magnesium transporter